MWKPGSRVAHTVVAVASLMLSVNAWPQLPPRPHSTNPAAGPTAGEGPNAELETLTRAVAIQARPDQLEYFHSTIDSTDSALEQSRELQRLGPAVNSIPILNSKSLQLRDTLDDVDHSYRRFLASFSKRQESELKPLCKRVRKSYSFVARESNRVQQLMEPGKIVPDRLISGAANLEKALSDFRTDQIRLGREMGIQSQ